MLDELDKLIIFLQYEYNSLCDKWQKHELYSPINQGKKLVKDIGNDSNILNAILNYRFFINENSLNIKIALNELKLQNEVNTRVKNQNSIEFKISNYMTEKHEFGEVPINKCLNDLYGIRIIFSENVNYDNIKRFIDDKYGKKLKCYDATKGNYVATHIYFKKNNYDFRWELQIWDKAHEKTNLISHEQYKQGYTKWEKENKGGGLS